MPASFKNILIGLFVLMALGVIVFMLLFLHPHVGDNGKLLRVRFTDIDKVNIGTRVTFAGHPVGEVIAIEELPDIRTSRPVHHGTVYVYELTLQIDSSVKIFNSDEIVIRTSGLLGERNIEINPQPPLPNVPLHEVGEEILYAAETPTVEETLKQFSAVSQKAEQLLTGLHQLVMSVQQEEIIPTIGQAVTHVRSIAQALDRPQQLTETVEAFHHLSQRVHASWDTVDQALHQLRFLVERAHRSWGTVDHFLFQLSAMSDRGRMLIDGMAQGKGTMGKLFVKDDLYLALKSIFHRGELLMNDMNQYGLLFHLDKRWQRMRAQRMHLLDKLSSPSSFAHHFDRELEQVSHSLAQVNVALTESTCYPQSLTSDPQFASRFAILIKDLERMEEALKMYNTQVINQEP